MPIILYKWRAHAGLPSLTAACLQTEAYLRLAKADFCVQECSSASSTPTGVIPAVDTGAEVPAAADAGDLAAARAILAALARTSSSSAASSSGSSSSPPSSLDLDAWLSPAQRAEHLAFVGLLASRLDPATQYTTWLEGRGFREFRRAAYSGSLPFPLNYIVPWSQRSEMGRVLGHIDGFKAYQGAVEVLAALADKLRASPGRFFFGAQPCSLDALLFGHLAFYRHSPVAAPVLRDKVDQQPVLSRYVDGILADFFATEVPPAPAGGDAGASWSDAAQGHKSARKHVPTVEEGRMWRGSQVWLAGAAAAVSAYVVLGGQYVTITTRDAAGDDEDEDEEQEVELEEDEDAAPQE